MSTTRPTTTRAVHLASRPHGAPTEDNFRIEEISLPELSDGQILVANDILPHGETHFPGNVRHVQ